MGDYLVVLTYWKKACFKIKSARCRSDGNDQSSRHSCGLVPLSKTARCHHISCPIGNNEMANRPLQYQRQPHAKKRRWFFRACVLVIAITLATVGYISGPSTYQKIRLLNYQRTCLNYSPPADQVVFDNNPERVALLANDPEFIVSGYFAYRKPPKAWVEMKAYSSKLSSNSRTSPSLILGTLVPPDVLLFMHELKCKSGTRLVAIERHEYWGLFTQMDINKCNRQH